MSMQTETIKERLQFILDELKVAADRRGEVAKEHIRTAVAHAEATRMELQKRLQEQDTQQRAQLQATIEHLQEVARRAKAAMDAKDVQFQESIDKSIASVKAAIEDRVSRN